MIFGKVVERRPEAFARREAHGHPIGERPFQVQARGDECALIETAVVGPQACHSGQFVGGHIGVLGVETWRVVSRLPVQRSRSQKALVKSVAVEAEPRREAVVLVEVVFEHKSACEAQMVAVEHFRAEGAVERIVICVGEEGNVGVVFVVQKVGVLHIGLATLCIEQDAERVGNRQHLAALALLLQVADTGVHYIATLGIFPAILQVQLPDCGRVVPQVAVIIVMAEVVLIVCQQDGAQVLAQMPVDCGIEFGLEAAVAVQVYLHRRGIFGLQVFDIDLACDALRAVLDARCALAHRDALHPSARHIAQGVRH